MKLGTTSPNFTPNGDSSTKLESQIPVSLSFINKDASDMMGSGTGAVVTYEQVINVFNTYIANTNLAALLDVDNLLGNAPIGSIFVKGATEWTYDTLSQYVLTPATTSALGGVKIGANISVLGDGTISVVDPYEYWTLGSGFTQEVKYGLLYNWYAATDVRNIANDGWHLPSTLETETLSTYLGGILIAGGYLKEIGFTYWNSPNTGADNSSQFNGRGSGGRITTGVFQNIMQSFTFWTSTNVNTDYARSAGVVYDSSSFAYNNSIEKKRGNSIRLIKDLTTLIHGQIGTYVGNDGKIYQTICIGTQEWLSENLAETKYRTGELIPEITGNTEWAALSTGALCAYNNDWNNALQEVGSSVNIYRHDLLNIMAGSNISISLANNALTIGASFTESDPIFNAWDKSTGITITKSQVSDFGTYLTAETDPIFGASAASTITTGMIAQWNGYTSYTHPTQSAISPTLAGANVLASLVVNTLGHVTSATSRTLTLADLGYTDSNYVHIVGTETITGSKTFSASTTTFNSIIATNSLGGIAVDVTSNYIALSGYSTGVEGYGMVGMSSYIPVQGTSLDTTASGRRIGLVLNGDSAHTSVANEYGIDIRWDMPWLGNTLNKPAGWMSCIWTNVGLNVEKSRFEWYTRKDGAIFLSMALSDSGKLIVPNLNISGGTANKFLYLDSNKDVAFTNAPSTIYTLTLPNAASVAARCSAAVEGVDYPTGWTIEAWSGNPNDLLITHNLSQRIIYVSAYTVSGTSERQLFGNAAYSGIIAPNQSSLRVESLATIATDIVVHLLFA